MSQFAAGDMPIAVVHPGDHVIMLLPEGTDPADAIDWRDQLATRMPTTVKVSAVSGDIRLVVVRGDADTPPPAGT